MSKKKIVPITKSVRGSAQITEADAKNFLEELCIICRRYNLSLAHEDTQGGFIVEHYSEHNEAWLKEASIKQDNKF